MNDRDPLANDSRTELRELTDPLVVVAFEGWKGGIARTTQWSGREGGHR